MSSTDISEVRDLLGPLDPLRRAAPVDDARTDPRAQALLARILDGEQAVAAPDRGGRRRAATGRPRLPRRLVLVVGALVATTAVASVAVVGLGVVPLPWNDTLPAAGAYAATPPPLVYAPVSGTAPEVLAAIAERAAALPDDAGTGRYARVEMQEWYLWTTVGDDGHTVTSVVMPQQNTTWLAADGSGRSVTSYDHPGILWTTTDETTYAPGERRDPWPTLSPDDATIAEQLALGHPASNGPAERLVAVNDLLRDQPMQPDVRAAVLRYLAATPTLELTGSVIDRLGRSGIGFSVTSAHSGLPTRYTLVVDPDDGRVLAWEEMLTTTAGRLNVPVPSVIGYTAYRSSGYVPTTED